MNAIIHLLESKFTAAGLSGQWASVCAAFSCTLAIVIVSFAACFGSWLIARKIAAGKIKSTRHRERSVALIKYLSVFLFMWINCSFLPSCFAKFPPAAYALSKMLDIITILSGAIVASGAVNWLHAAAHHSQAGKTFASKTIIQVLKILIWCTVTIIVVSRILDKSPTFVLSGLGAMTAVLMLVFRDSILGLVAGIQVSQNDMVRIGDWITMPKYNADGTVIDIALTTVKVRNFDNTVTMIPSSVLISDAFVNWRYMSDSKGRRIKREVLISASSISPMTERMLERLITEGLAIAGDAPSSNLVAFETWLERMLKRDERISEELTCMVRQTNPGDTGIPIEVYAFTKTRDWVEYEKIQSEIFDLIYITVPRFGLRIYQRTGDISAGLALD